MSNYVIQSPLNSKVNDIVSLQNFVILELTGGFYEHKLLAIYRLPNIEIPRVGSDKDELREP